MGFPKCTSLSSAVCYTGGSANTAWLCLWIYTIPNQQRYLSRYYCLSLPPDFLSFDKFNCLVARVSVHSQCPGRVIQRPACDRISLNSAEDPPSGPTNPEFGCRHVAHKWQTVPSLRRPETCPQELIDLILGNTDSADTDTLTCALVARSFRPRSQKLIFLRSYDSASGTGHRSCFATSLRRALCIPASGAAHSHAASRSTNE
ncbi:hypothetical protein B0H16DRAFT_1694527, partial [Mycena metata]